MQKSNFQCSYVVVKGCSKAIKIRSEILDNNTQNNSEYATKCHKEIENHHHFGRNKTKSKEILLKSVHKFQCSCGSIHR